MQFLDAAAGALLRTIIDTSYAYCVAWSPDSSLLAVGNVIGEVRIVQRASGRVLSLTGASGRVKAVHWSPDGRRVASAGSDGTVRIWAPEISTVPTVLRSHADEVNAVAWSPDGSRLAAAYADNRTVRVSDAASGRRPDRLKADDDVLAVCLVPRRQPARDCRRERHNVNVERCHSQANARLTGHTDWVRAVAWSTDGVRLATASDDETIRIWNPTSGKQTKKLTGHTHEVTGVDWSPDGTCLASVDKSGLVIVWEPGGRRVTSVVLQPSECLAWSRP